MTNDEIKKYLKNELPLMERVKFIEELENDLFLKESIEGVGNVDEKQQSYFY